MAQSSFGYRSKARVKAGDTLPKNIKIGSTEGEQWQPDGWGSLGRIGILLPAGDAVPESEFSAMTPQGISIHAGHVPFGPRADQVRHPLVAGGVDADTTLELAQFLEA